MSTAYVEYKGNLITEATHVESGTKILTDAPVDNEGQGSAFSPTDLVSTSLAICMLTTMGIVAKKRNINMDGTKAEVTKIMASEPRRIGEIQVNITFPQPLSEEERSILRRVGEHCPVGNSLSADLKEVINYK